EGLESRRLGPGAGGRGLEAARPAALPTAHPRQQMIGRLTPNLRWQTATPVLQQALGRPVEELNGRPFLRVVHPADRARVHKALAKTLEDGETHNVVFRARPAAPPAAPPGGPPTPDRYLQADIIVYYDGQGRPAQLR